MTATPDLIPVLEELIESHLDTIELVMGGSESDDWTQHLGYLRRLLQVANGTMAAATAHTIQFWSAG